MQTRRSLARESRERTIIRLVGGNGESRKHPKQRERERERGFSRFLRRAKSTTFGRSKRDPSSWNGMKSSPDIGFIKHAYKIKLNSSLFPFLSRGSTNRQVRSRRPDRPGGGRCTEEPEDLGPRGMEKKRQRHRRKREQKARVKLKSQQEGSWSVVARLWLSMFARVRRRETRFAFFLRAFFVVEHARAIHESPSSCRLLRIPRDTQGGSN